MAITWANLFAPLGQVINKTNIYKGWIADVETNQDELLSTLNSQAAHHLMDDVPDVYQALQNQITAWIGGLKGFADKILTNRDVVTSQLPIGDVAGAQEVIPHLRRAMTADSQTVKKCTVTIGSATYTLSNSDAVKVITTKVLDGVSSPANNSLANPDYAGLDSELGQDSQTISMICTADSESGGVNQGAEVFSVVGNPLQPSYTRLSEGMGETVGTCAQGAGTSIVANGQFEDWTGGNPDDWTVVDGTPTTEFVEDANGLRGSSSFKIVAGSVDIELQQLIDSDQLIRRRAYMLIALVEKAGTTGVIDIKVLEGVTEKAAVTINMATAASGWNLLSDLFIVDDEILEPWKLQITALSTFDGSPLVDDVLIVPVTYVNGIGYVLVAMDNTIILGDKIEFAVSNDNAGLIQTYMRRTYGAQLPSSSSNSIDESYATGLRITPAAANLNMSAVNPTVTVA